MTQYMDRGYIGGTEYGHVDNLIYTDGHVTPSHVDAKDLVQWLLPRDADDCKENSEVLPLIPGPYVVAKISGNEKSVHCLCHVSNKSNGCCFVTNDLLSAAKAYGHEPIPPQHLALKTLIGLHKCVTITKSSVIFNLIVL
eukprot:130550_1